MSTFVALLRAINVSGRNRIPMAELRSLFEELGLAKVQIYLQSGNVVFRTAGAKPGALATDIEGRIRTELGLDVAVLVRTRRELDAIAARNPFLGARTDVTKLHVVFLEDRPPVRALADLDLDRYRPDELELQGREVFLSCPKGYGTTKLNNAFFERRLDTRATTRSWKTLTSLVELARA